MPKRRRKGQKRDTSRKHRIILSSATDVFIQKGYETSSMDEIAEAAGVSKRTIYNHFKSKEKLFQEIVGQFIAERDGIKPIEYSKTLPIDQQLRRFVQAELYLIDDPVRRGLSKLLTSVFLMNMDFGKATRSLYSPHEDLIRWLEAARRDGKLSYQSPEMAARIFYGLVEGCITWGAMMSDGETLQYAGPVIDELISVFLDRYGTHSR